MADQPANGQVSSWDSAVNDMRDMGLKYMNAALNAAGNTTGGITRNQFNFPPQPASSAAPGIPVPAAGLSGLVKTGIAAAAICGTGGMGLGIASMLGAFSGPTPATPPAAVQPADQNIGVKADLIVVPPGAAQ